MIQKGQGYGSSFIYATADITTITNSTDEISQFSGSALGSKIFRANTLKVGDIIHLQTRVLVTTGVAQESTFRIGLGGVNIVTSVGTLPNNLSDAYAELDIQLKVLSLGVTGTVCCMGRTFIHATTGISSTVMRPLVSAIPIVIDTTIDNVVDLTYQWTTASAGNILEIRTASINFYN